LVNFSRMSPSGTLIIDDDIYHIGASLKDLGQRGLLTSSINTAIYQTFMEHGIEIPYPRRDVHILRGETSNQSQMSNSQPPDGAASAL